LLNDDKESRDQGELMKDRAPSTTSSDSWAFPERSMERLNPKQQRRRRREDAERLHEVDSRTSYQLEHQRFGRHYHELVRPFYLFLLMQGRCPFTWRDNLDGTWIFTSRWESWRTQLFNLTAWLIVFIILATTFNGLGIILVSDQVEGNDTRARLIHIRERVILHRYVNLFFSAYGALFHALFVSLNIYLKSDLSLRYLTYWTEALQSLKIDVAVGLFSFRNKLLGTLGIMYLTYIVCACIRFSATSAGGPSIMGYLMFRMAATDMLVRGENYDGTQAFNPTWFFVQILGGLVFMLTIIWAKGYILLFIIKVRNLLVKKPALERFLKKLPA
jgi:hypothetical protein